LIRRLPAPSQLGDLDSPDEDEVECLCKLMTSIGSLIDHARAKSHMDEYFSRMQAMSGNMELATRMRFMLQVDDASSNY